MENELNCECPTRRPARTPGNATHDVSARLRITSHAAHLKENPPQWMPWNYREALAALSIGPDPPR